MTFPLSKSNARVRKESAPDPVRRSEVGGRVPRCVEGGIKFGRVEKPSTTVLAERCPTSAFDYALTALAFAAVLLGGWAAMWVL